MPVAVVPAAGASRRMGRPKLLLPYGGGTVVGATVAALRGGGARTVVLVVAPAGRGQGAEELAAWGRERGLVVAVNPDPGRGMLSSVQEGIAALGAAPGGSRLLVCPGDLPRLQAGTVRRLLAAQGTSGEPLAVPTWQGRRGHPLLIAPAVVAEIATLEPAVGLRQLLERHPGEVLALPVDDPGVLADLDTTEEYAALRRRGALPAGDGEP